MQKTDGGALFFCLFTRRAFYDVRMLGYYCVSLSLFFSFSHLICWLTMWMDILKDADGVFLLLFTFGSRSTQ